MPVVLAGCSLLPGQSSDGAPSRPPTPVAPTSAVPTSTGPSPVPSASAGTPAPTVPDFTVSTFPTVVVPTADTTEKGLRVRQTTIRGRSADASWAISIPVFSGESVAKEVNRRVRAAANDLIGQVRREAKSDAG